MSEPKPCKKKKKKARSAPSDLERVLMSAVIRTGEDPVLICPIGEFSRYGMKRKLRPPY